MLEEQLSLYCSKYRSIDCPEDFYGRLSETCTLINDKSKHAPKQVFDVFGRVYTYKSDKELSEIHKHIQNDTITWEATKKIANILI